MECKIETWAKSKGKKMFSRVTVVLFKVGSLTEDGAYQLGQNGLPARSSHLPSSRIIVCGTMPGHSMGPGNQNPSSCDHMASALLLHLPSGSSIVYRTLGSRAYVANRLRKGSSYIVLFSKHH